MSSDPELDSFKRTISLTDFAGSMGYAIDWRDSWSVKRWDGSFVMRNAQDDKPVCACSSKEFCGYLTDIL